MSIRQSSKPLQQHAFILLPVILTLTIIAAIAYLLSSEGAINAGNVNRQQQQDTALYVAQAGYHHAIWQLNRKNCTGYTDIPATTFGRHSYLASYTDTLGASLTTGSPINIKVESIHTSGAKYTIKRNREKIYQFPTQQLILQPDATSGKDTYLYMWKKTWNYGLSTTLWVRNNWADSLAYSLLNFDVSTLPSEAKIISAKLKLWQNTPSANGGTVSVHRIINDWVEGTKTGGIGIASWNDRDTGISWITPGGDHSSEAETSTNIPAATIGWYQWDITNLVSDWFNGAQVNHGFILKPESVNTYVEFNSSDSTDPTIRPKLTIKYTCECGKPCDAVGTPPPSAKKIYWTDDIANKIQRSDEDGSNVEDIIINLNRPTGLDIDTVNNKIYWTNRLQLQRANLDGSNLETIYSGSINTFDIKLDIVAGKMYWTHDNGVNQVMRANLDGSNSQIINTTLNSPSYFTLDISAGHIYLTSFGDGAVSRINLDGSNSTSLVSGSSGTVGNAIDLINGKIYWTGGATFDWIKRADLDGNNVEEIITGLNAPQDIVYDADNDRIYWVDALNVLVQRANSDGSNVENLVSTNMTRPRGIALVNADDVKVCSGNFRDEFNDINFTGSDGSLAWKTDWQEVGETDGADSGDIRVIDEQSEFQLRLRDNDNGGEGVSREVDLTGASAAILSLKYRRSGLDSPSDYVSVELSSTGSAGPWVERARFVGSTNDSGYLSWSYTLEASEISANTTIRLRTSSTMGGNDNIYFDDIEIQCSP